MKGMLDFLEKAGLVKKDSSTEAMAFSTAPTPARASPVANQTSTRPAMVADSTALNLDSIYAHAGIAPSVYPAERLLRLVDGLSAMDEATRRMAIKAMDEADESWTIADPLADASAKLQALAQHTEHLQLNLQQLERETQARLVAVTARQEQVVGDIRKQISELEALVARELARAAQETAAQESQLQTARDQTGRELAGVAHISQRLQGLALQFGGTNNTTQE